MKPLWGMTEEEIKAYWNVTWKHPQPRWQDQQMAGSTDRPRRHQMPPRPRSAPSDASALPMRIPWLTRKPRVYRVVHQDTRRRVLTIEREGISRRWTPYAPLTVESVYGGMEFREGSLIEIVSPRQSTKIRSGTA